MQRILKSILLFKLPFAVLGCLLPIAGKAQITPDGTTSTTVNQEGNNFTIEQGDLINSNLFHSFKNFSVPSFGSAVFNNANDITNIFSRVSGGNISNIDGLIEAQGSANLFLLNPNGIVFGENASLNLGGSFFATTADSILFDGDKEFSAVNPEAPPLLKVNIPIGVRFRDNPGDIINRSFANNGNGLSVLPTKNITLLSGNVSFDGGRIFAPGGKVQLGSLIGSGTVEISENARIIIPDNVKQGDISLTNFAGVGVFAVEGGSIEVNAKHLELTSGGFFWAGISSNQGFSDAQSGNIIINTTDSILIDGMNSSSVTGILNRVFDNGIGNSGDVEIKTGSLFLINGGLISTNLSGQGSAGDVNITASNDITINGKNNSDTGLFNLVNHNGVGTSGDIDISTETLTISNAGQINNNIFGLGSAGSINIRASDSIMLTNNGFIVSDLKSSAIGNIATITIDSPNLTIHEGSLISGSSFSNGDAGDIDINSEIIDISRGKNSNKTGIYAQVGGSTFTLDENNEPVLTGNAGKITITTSQLKISDSFTALSTTINSKGNAGILDITATESITVSNSAQLLANTKGFVRTELIETGETPEFVDSYFGSIGDSGSVVINTPSISIDGGEIVVDNVGEGNAGIVDINTNILSLTHGGRISGNIFGRGSGGEISVKAKTIEILDSNFSSNLRTSSQGIAGNISINTNTLSISGAGAGISASSSGNGSAGNLKIIASESVNLNNDSGLFTDIIFRDFLSQVFSELDTTQSIIFDPKIIGDGGNINITTPFLNLVDGGIISATNFHQGIGGSLTINTNAINLSNRSQINSSFQGIGEAGNITINAIDSINLTGESLIVSIVDEQATGDGGGINLTTKKLSLNNSFISSSSSGQGNAGDIIIKVYESIKLNNNTSVSSQLNPNGEGTGGNVSITTENLTVADSNITVNSSGTGSAGNLKIESGMINLKNKAAIKAITQFGNGGNIILTISKDITLQNDSDIVALALQNADGGNITIKANDGVIIAFPNQDNDINSNADRGNGGNIDIYTQAIFGLEERSSTPPNQTNDIDASSEFGLQGNFSLNTPDIDPTSSLIELPSVVGDASDQISQNPCEQGVGSEFFDTGKGGLPPNPHQALNNNRVMEIDLLDTVVMQQESNNVVNYPNDTVSPNTDTSTSRAKPARGWKFNDKGKVVLVDYSSGNRDIKYPTKVNHSNCSGN